KRGTLTFQETKNGERRSVPLTGHALDLLRQHAKVRRLDTDCVFPLYTSTKRPRVRYAWYTALKRAGIKDCRFHDLRHSAASYLAMNGASLMEIAEVLGHKTLAIVKRYAHLRRPAKITWPLLPSIWYAWLYGEPNHTGHHSEVCHPESSLG